MPSLVWEHGLYPDDRLKAVPPSLDELASEWLHCAQVAQMPSMHNFHEMACGADLVGVNFLPGHRIYRCLWSAVVHLQHILTCRMSINGESADAAYCGWSAYEASRRATLDGLEIVSATRHALEANAIPLASPPANHSSSAKTATSVSFGKARCCETEERYFTPRANHAFCLPFP